MSSIDAAVYTDAACRFDAFTLDALSLDALSFYAHASLTPLEADVA